MVLEDAGEVSKWASPYRLGAPPCSHPSPGTPSGFCHQGWLLLEPHPQGLICTGSSEGRHEEPAPICGGGDPGIDTQRLLGAHEGVGEEGRKRSPEGSSEAGVGTLCHLRLCQATVLPEAGPGNVLVHGHRGVHAHTGLQGQEEEGAPAQTQPSPGEHEAVKG